jgi:hypothetical protein
MNGDEPRKRATVPAIIPGPNPTPGSCRSEWRELLFLFAALSGTFSIGLVFMVAICLMLKLLGVK